tara:strand:+ start:2526 stop:3209 length:684 start_codon:yes stop_codon:yes gene_type:complete
MENYEGDFDMAKIDAWMPVYIGDLLKDTQDLSAAEFGAYHYLMYHYWCKKGDVDNNMATLRRVCKCSPKVLERILQFFEQKNKKIYHKRLSEELEKAERQYNQKSEAGKASAAKRASTAVEKPLPSRCQPSQSQSQSSNYIYEGKVIKLNKNDYEEWKTLYKNLEPFDEYLNQIDAVMFAENPDQKKWFVPAMQKLFYQNKNVKKTASPKKSQVSRNLVSLKALKHA